METVYVIACKRLFQKKISASKTFISIKIALICFLFLFLSAFTVFK